MCGIFRDALLVKESFTELGLSIFIGSRAHGAGDGCRSAACIGANYSILDTSFMLGAAVTTSRRRAVDSSRARPHTHS